MQSSHVPSITVLKLMLNIILILGGTAARVWVPFGVGGGSNYS